MTDMVMKEMEAVGEGQFENLVDDYQYDRPKQGQIIDGKVIRIYDDMILVDIGAKRDAIIPKNDLSKLDSGFLENISAGDHVPVYVFSAGAGDDDLLVSLDKGLTQEDWDQAQKHLEDNSLVDLKVVGYNGGGLLVEFNRLEGFIPNSHLTAIPRGSSSQKKDDIKSNMIGTTLQAKLLEVDQKHGRLLFSERNAFQELRQRRLEELEKGRVLQGKVVNIVDFGAFIDLDGIDGLIHISELAWERVDHPSKLLSVGDQIEVEVMNVDIERERVSLTRKPLLPNPWEQLMEHHKIGDLVEGEVTNVRDFGAFVKVEEGVVGLVHVSEIGFTGSGHPKEVVKPGDKILARIIEIDPEKERLSLSMQRVTYEEQMTWMVENMDSSEQEQSVSAMQAALKRAVEEEATSKTPLPDPTRETPSDEDLSEETIPPQEPTEELTQELPKDTNGESTESADTPT
jgi:small subunit ribosomal protein S1